MCGRLPDGVDLAFEAVGHALSRAHRAHGSRNRCFTTRNAAPRNTGFGSAEARRIRGARGSAEAADLFEKGKFR